MSRLACCAMSIQIVLEGSNRLLKITISLFDEENLILTNLTPGDGIEVAQNILKMSSKPDAIFCSQ